MLAILLPPDHGFERLPVRVGEAHLLAILKLDVICGDALDPFAAQVREGLSQVDTCPVWFCGIRIKALGVKVHGVSFGIGFQALEQLEIRAEDVSVVGVLRGVMEEGGIFIVRAPQYVFVLL